MMQKTLLSAVLALVALTSALAQPRVGVSVPPRTHEGEWSGTWAYANREFKMAIWIRPKSPGSEELEWRVRAVYLKDAESFSTDWTASTRYYHLDKEGTFSLKLKSVSDLELTGSWDWLVRRDGENRRIERGDFVAFRSLHGRSLVFHFRDFEKVYTIKGREMRFAPEFSYSSGKCLAGSSTGTRSPF